MNVIESISKLQAQSREWRAQGRPVALVPTMGALHPGHTSLVRSALHEGARVIVSIFVNPLQFGPEEDFSRYPRTFDADVRTIEAAGAHAVFHPGVGEMYPTGFTTRVSVGDLGHFLEGKARPGHFDGVVTVVARLLGAAIPDRAYFGQKDAQQLAVIRRMVRDLAIPVEIVGCPTVREQDGLAMSSRNRYLGTADRALALGLVRALAEAQALYQDGIRAIPAIEAAMWAVLRAHRLSPDYATLVDPDTFGAPGPGRPWLAAIAAPVGPARLIDNAAVEDGNLLGYRQVEHFASGLAV
ncbi:MAG: pantoate--beta-alanine ligase [Candidatus Dormibacteria bacterium]